MPDRYPTLLEHFTAPGPKRILALDGGGLRGIVTLEFLARVEAVLRDQHGADDDFRLAHYFDLIAGTSTGAIIAAALAKGMSVNQVIEHYLVLGREVFRRSVMRLPGLQARYDANRLTEHLKEVLGSETRLGGPELLTGLLVVAKRLDSGGIWPLGNNPNGRYYKAGPGDQWISNADYPLWQVVRASTAAPMIFVPEELTIAEKPGKPAVVGEFVDGAVSPFNNPALQALMYATLDGYNVRWPVGENRLFILSVGTGLGVRTQATSIIAAFSAAHALLGLINDCGTLVETLMQWLSRGALPIVHDREIGTLRNDLLGGVPLFTYRRYDVSLAPADVRTMISDIDAEQLATLGDIDRPDNVPLLQELGEIGAWVVREEHFPAGFALGATSPAQ
jgi:predicted acylesterase/phospholipase RssA